MFKRQATGAKKPLNKKALDSKRYPKFRGSGMSQEAYDARTDTWVALADLVENVVGALADASPAAVCDFGGSWASPSVDSGYSSSDSGGGDCGCSCGGD